MDSISCLEYKEINSKQMQLLKEANVFFSNEFAEFVENQDEKYLYLTDAERILPVRFRRKYLFSWAVIESEPYELKKPTKTLESFLNEATALLKANGAQWVLSTAACFFEDTPQRVKRIPFGSHVIDLNLTEEQLWANIHSKHRNVIRKAEKENVVISKGSIELLDDYVRLDNETWNRSHAAGQGEAYFKAQLNHLKEEAIIYIAYYNGEPQASAFYYYNNAMCYYMYGASKNNPITGAANLLQWQAIKDMKALGVKEFSFVGCRINEDENSKYHGIQRFKSRFGGELRQGYLFRIVNKPIYYRLYRLAMRIRTGNLRKPYRDAIDEEIHKWKDIQK